MATTDDRTAQGFADLVRIVPCKRRYDAFGLAVAFPRSIDLALWGIAHLSGRWEGDQAADGYLTVGAFEIEAQIGDDVGSDRWLAAVQAALVGGGWNSTRPVRLNNLLHAFGRCDRPLDGNEEDPIAGGLHLWLGRTPTIKERGIVARRTLALATTFPASGTLLSPELLDLFDFATEFDSHHLEMVTGEGAVAIRAACAAFPMLASEIASSEDVGEGLLAEMSIEAALEGGMIAPSLNSGDRDLPPLTAGTVAWLKGLRCRPRIWEPSAAISLVEFANEVEPDLLPREPAEFEAFVDVYEAAMDMMSDVDAYDWDEPKGREIVDMLPKSVAALAEVGGWDGFMPLWPEGTVDLEDRR